MMKADFPGQGVGRLGLGGGVPPADAKQRFIVHGLGIDGNAGGPRIPQNQQLFFIQGVGAARLHRHLPRLANEGLGGLQRPPQQRCGQGGGGSAAHVKGPGDQALLLNQLQRSGNFLFQRLRIGKQLPPLAHLAA